MKNYIIGLVAVGDRHVSEAKTFVDELGSFLDVNIIVLTDKPNSFDGCQNVIKTIVRENEIFSYHEKYKIFEEGFKLSDTVLLLDADCTLKERQYITHYDTTHLEDGIYPQVIWKCPNECCMESFLSGNNWRVPYGREFKEFCDSKSFDYNDTDLLQESFLLIKSKDKTKSDKFISTWKELKSFCDEKDKERQQSLLGYGEGYSVAVSAKTADLKVHDGNEEISRFASGIRHYAWEPKDH